MVVPSGWFWLTFWTDERMVQKPARERERESHHMQALPKTHWADRITKETWSLSNIRVPNFPRALPEKMDMKINFNLETKKR